MKIAVISSIFIPGSGYLEEGIASVLAGMGHEVRVLASYHYPFHTSKIDRVLLRQDETIELSKPGFAYRITRFKTFLKVRSNIVCIGLKKEIRNFTPDLVVLVGVSDFFPLFLLNKRFGSSYRTYVFIGQNYDMSHWRKSNSGLKKSYSFIVNNLFKGFLYRKAVRYFSKIIFYTPDSAEIINKLLSPKLNKILRGKEITIPLGYNSDDYSFLPEAREEVRERLKIPTDKTVIITVTRIENSKRIVEIIEDLFVKNETNAIYLLIGFVQNQYKIEIEQLIRANQLQKKVLCFPFLQKEKIVEYLSAADFGIWLQSGISIQQSMGTGLPVFLPMRSTTSILLQDGLNGYYINKSVYETVSMAISSYSYSPEKRMQIEQHNKRLYSFQSIFNEIFN